MVCLLPSVPPFMLRMSAYPGDVCIDVGLVLSRLQVYPKKVCSYVALFEKVHGEL